MINQVSFFPQRLRYPSAFRNTDPKGYTKTSLLGGPDNVFTPCGGLKTVISYY